MRRYFGYTLLLGVLFFLGREYWLSQPKVVVGPGFAAIRTQSEQTYALGDGSQLSRFQPFGYFFDHENLSEPTYWTDDFAVIRFKKHRLFWFGKNFNWAEISKLPVRLNSDFWLVSDTFELDEMPPPKEKIIWLHPTKRVPKKIKELGPVVMDVQKVGVRTLDLE